MKSILVNNDNIMVFQPKLAKLIGINEAIILNQIHYWIEKKKNIIEGRSWVYNTYENWQSQLCYLSVSTIKKSIKKLETMGIVISGNFNKAKIDKTKWYTIDYDKLQQLYEKEESNLEGVTNSTDTIEQTVQNNTFTDINTLTSGLNMSMEESNSNQAIPETNSDITTKVNEEKDNDLCKRSSDLKKVLDFYSENLSLPSSYELERIKELCEEFKDSELIIFALKQSIESNARNLRYVEKVLYNWKDKGIRTTEEAEKLVLDYKKYKGDRENGRGKRSNSKNRGNNPKDAAKDQGKWAGYRPPEPKWTGSFNYEGLI